MAARDPVDELVMLCRAAAEAGEDWRGRLRDEWVPGVLGSLPGAVIEAALHEWTPPEGSGEELGSALEGAVVAAMADDGYD